MRLQRSMRSALLYAGLFLFALYFLAPLYVMVVASFKTLDEVRGSSIIALPQVWTIQPWIKAWSGACTGLNCTGIRPYFIATFEIAHSRGHPVRAVRVAQRLCDGQVAKPRS